MGGDYGSAVTVPASLAVLQKLPTLSLTLVGDQSEIESQIAAFGTAASDRIQIVHTEEVIQMDDKPSIALRKKKNSSTYQAIELVSQTAAQACVSAGNTGALLAIGCYLLKTFPGVDRPAIVSAFPTLDGRCFILDLGANAAVQPQSLCQFAVMANAMLEAIYDIASPRVGILNMGKEVGKGNELVQLADELIRKIEPLNYIGFVEPSDIFEGRVDIAVCDGFVGNMMLKTMEGVASMVDQLLAKQINKKELIGEHSSTISALLSTVRGQLDPRKYNGASFLGLQGIVVKSHGAADQSSFEQALYTAIAAVESDLPNQIRKRVAPGHH